MENRFGVPPLGGWAPGPPEGGTPSAGLPWSKLVSRHALTSRSLSRPGFTLIELLVVISIISILASLILPSLSGAKERAKETVCLNNLHQMGIAIRLYQDDYGSRFPSAFVRESNGAVKDARWTLGGRSPRPELASEYLQAEARPLWHYMQAAEAFKCPSDRGVTVQACGGPALRDKWKDVGCSYHYNAGGLTKVAGGGTRLGEADSAAGLADKKEDWVPNPSLYLLVHEPPARPWGCAGQSAVWVQWHRSPRNAQNNFTDPALAPQKFISPVLFADSHARIHDFTKSLTINPNYPYEPTANWIWYKPASVSASGF